MAKKIKTSFNINRLSHRKGEAIKKKKKEIQGLKLSGYCSNCLKIRKMEDVREDWHIGKVFIGYCEICGTEIYKKRG